MNYAVRPDRLRQFYNFLHVFSQLFNIQTLEPQNDVISHYSNQKNRFIWL